MPCDVRVGRGPLGRQDTRKGGSTGKKRERKSKKKNSLEKCHNETSFLIKRKIK